MRERIRIPAFVLAALALGSIAVAQTLPELFGKVKTEIKSESWAEALKTMDALETEAAKPGNESAQKQLAGPLAFYRGVCSANLGKTDEAVASFGAFLKLQPGAAIDSAVYSKKAVAAFEKARIASAERAPSLAEAYKEFQPPADAKDRYPADQYWAEGAVRWIMTDSEKTAWSAITEPNARVTFVEEFWTARAPCPAPTAGRIGRSSSAASPSPIRTSRRTRSSAGAGRTGEWSSCCWARRPSLAASP